MLKYNSNEALQRPTIKCSDIYRRDGWTYSDLNGLLETTEFLKVFERHFDVKVPRRTLQLYTSPGLRLMPLPIHKGGYNGTAGTPVSNVRFENIRIEADYGWTGDFIQLVPGDSIGLDTAVGPPGSIQNVYFKNITLTGYRNPATQGTIRVSGPSASAFVKDVTFENVVRYGQLTAANSANVVVGSNSSNIVFVGGGNPPLPPPSGFPVDLQGATLPEARSVVISVSKPANVNDAAITLAAFDADNADEGTVTINGACPVSLFGAQGVGADSQVISVVYTVPASCFNNGSNTLLFTHSNTIGYRIDSAQVAFSGAPLIPTDLNGDGITNIADAQLAINQALGITTCATGDVNNDGSCNVVDVQQIVNKALGA